MKSVFIFENKGRACPRTRERDMLARRPREGSEWEGSRFFFLFMLFAFASAQNTFTITSTLPSRRLLIVPLDTMPTYLSNYLDSGNRTGIVEMYRYNATRQLLLVVTQDWPFLTRLASSAQSQDASTPTTERIYLSQVKRVQVQAPGPRPTLPIGPIQIDPDFGVGGQDMEASLTTSWALDRIDQRSKPLDNQYYGYSATSTAKRAVHVYVLDTGIYSHPDFSCPVIESFNYYPSDGSGDCNGKKRTKS